MRSEKSIAGSGGFVGVGSSASGPGRLRPAVLAALLLLASRGAALEAALEPDPAVAAIVQEITAESLLADVNDLVAFGTRRSDQPGGRAAQEWIREFLSRLPLDETYLHDFDGGADNVIGILRGAQRPGRFHVIGAHYDSSVGAGPTAPAPGADDNASGTAAVLEAARAIASSGRRPAETIVFALFAAEEQGKVGSRHFVQEIAALGWDIADMVCLDVIGYVKPGTRLDLSVSSSSFTPEIDALIARLGEVAAAYLPDWPFEGGKGCG